MRGAYGGKISTFAALAVLLSLLFIAPAMAEKRIALVMGNSAYQNVTRLDNPRNDAALMADTLTGLGFTLIGGRAQLDLDKSAMDGAVQNFGRQVQGADVALFYYAGHGVQVAGSNYLVPISANPTREADVDFQMVDVNLVLRQMQGSGTRLNMVILDACRNNPFGARGLRASDGGLAQMRAPEGTLISYATQPGNVAQDGSDGNSPYTKALASTIKQSGLDIFQTFNRVGLAVKRDTGGAQQPWVSSSPIDGTFYFVAPSAAASPQVAAAPPSAQQLSSTLRADPDRIPIKDVTLLRELSDRLFEHNFDPE
ncbi:MAG: caspase family protein, partial [Bradyrhizobium sp.]|nr:caspase family protein [Bradyrhizobium sp.]